MMLARYAELARHVDRLGTPVLSFDYEQLIKEPENVRERPWSGQCVARMRKPAARALVVSKRNPEPTTLRSCAIEGNDVAPKKSRGVNVA